MKNKNVIIEDILLKYKPGININYRNKYVVLTSDSIQVFKNACEAKIPNLECKTKLIIPLTGIQSCQRVKVQTGKSKKDVDKSLFQFEIFLKEE